MYLLATGMKFFYKDVELINLQLQRADETQSDKFMIK